MGHLTQLPSELLLHILSFLPIRSLLAFSLVNHLAHDFASSNLHTLSLGIYPTRVSSLISHLSRTRSTTPSYLCSTQKLSGSDSIPSLLFKTSSISSEPFSKARTVIHVIPKALKLRPHILLAFHTVLATSILNRYSMWMHHLELSIWTLTPAIADAIANLKNTRTLCLRIEDPSGRGFLRHSTTDWGFAADTDIDIDAAGEEHENRSLGRIPLAPSSSSYGSEWNRFAGAWSRLETLRLVSAKVSSQQLGRILRGNAELKELWLEKCPNIGIEFLQVLCDEWEGNDNIQTLGLVDCDRAATVSAQTVTCIRNLSNLQFLSLLGCRGLMNKTIERLNSESWHIPYVEFPGTCTPDIRSMPTVIKIDPVYMDEDV